MPTECSKARERRLRDPLFAEQYFVGVGIDVGGGEDGLGQQDWPGMISCRTWDLPDGNAQFLETIPADSYDFLHSSHCLEHMVDPITALAHWVRVVKPGGWLVITVPDEDLYEQGVFPSTFNGDHKWTFTTFKPGASWSQHSISLLSMLTRLGMVIEVVKIEQLHRLYDWQATERKDQTQGPAECAIEIVLRKRRARELADGGRLPAWKV